MKFLVILLVLIFSSSTFAESSNSLDYDIDGLEEMLTLENGVDNNGELCSLRVDFRNNVATFEYGTTDREICETDLESISWQLVNLGTVSFLNGNATLMVYFADGKAYKAVRNAEYEESVVCGRNHLDL